MWPRRRRRGRPRPSARASRGSGRAPSPMHTASRLELELVRREHGRGPATNTSRRSASMTGKAPGAPAARASSVETPATGDLEREGKASRDREPDAGAREASGAGTDDERVEVAGCAPACAQQRVDIGEQRLRAPSPLAEHLAVADERRSSPPRSRCRTRGSAPAMPSSSAPRPRRARAAAIAGSTCPSVDRDARRRKRRRTCLRPLDEDDRVVEVRLEVAPLGRRDAREAVEVEMGDRDPPAVAVTDRERRARHRLGHAERSARAADERRLPRRPARPRPSRRRRARGGRRASRLSAPSRPPTRWRARSARQKRPSWTDSASGVGDERRRLARARSASPPRPLERSRGSARSPPRGPSASTACRARPPDGRSDTAAPFASRA